MMLYVSRKCLMFTLTVFGQIWNASFFHFSTVAHTSDKARYFYTVDKQTSLHTSDSGWANVNSPVIFFPNNLRNSILLTGPDVAYSAQQAGLGSGQTRAQVKNLNSIYHFQIQIKIDLHCESTNSPEVTECCW